MLKLKKLEDTALKNISGGNPPKFEKCGGDVDAAGLKAHASELLATAADFRRVADGSQEGSSCGGGLLVAGVVGVLGCSIAASICKAVSVNAMKSGNSVKSATYQKAAIGLGVCLAPFVALGIGGGVKIARSC